MGSLLLEMYEDFYANLQDAKEQWENAKSREERKALRAHITALAEALDEPDPTIVRDALAEEWIKDLEAGRDPDLEKGFAYAK